MPIKTTDLTNTFLEIAGLKNVLRYKSSLKKGGDSVAEHSWNLAFMCLQLIETYKIKCNQELVVKYALLHDIAELYTDDIDCSNSVGGTEKFWQQKSKKEQSVIEKKFRNHPQAKWIYKIWNDYERGHSFEAQFVRVVDKIESYLHLLRSEKSDYKLNKLYLTFADYALGHLQDQKIKKQLQILLLDIQKRLLKKYNSKGR